MAEPLIAHSLAEVRLYLSAKPCDHCGDGPLIGNTNPSACGESQADVVAIDAMCDACRFTTTLMFQIPKDTDTVDSSAPPAINPTDEPSRILDVGQWIVLFRVIIESAGRETNKMAARRLGLEAAQCLEEALKFYDEVDNDLPPLEALYNEASCERFRQHPEQFSKRRLIELRSKLPSLTVMRKSLSAKKKRSWLPWKRGGSG